MTNKIEVNKNHQNSDRDARPRKPQDLMRQVRTASTGPRGGAAKFLALSIVAFMIYHPTTQGDDCEFK